MSKVMLLALGTLWLFAAGCARNGVLPAAIPGLERMTDEQKIAYVLEDVWRGMEARRVYQVLAHVSPRYLDQEGRDYTAIQEHVSYIMKAYTSIKITRMRPKIWIAGERARAVETFGTIAAPRDERKDPPINLQGQVMVYLERAGGTWQIVEWGPLQ